MTGLEKKQDWNSLEHKKIQYENIMWFCCNNQTALADKPFFISWLMCKSSKYEGGNQKRSRDRKTVSGSEEKKSCPSK